MKSLVILLMGLGMVGCGSGPKNIDPAFMDTLKQIDASFQKAGAKDVPLLTTTDIQFGDPTQGGKQNGDTVGICIQDATGNHIIIDKKTWDSVSDSFRKYLLAHEIGHCVLGRSHDVKLVQLTLFMPEVPESIMNPESELAANWASEYDNYYFSELLKFWPHQNP